MPIGLLQPRSASDGRRSSDFGKLRRRGGIGWEPLTGNEAHEVATKLIHTRVKNSIYRTREIRLPEAPRVVHVLGPVLGRNLAQPDRSRHEPVVAIRSAANPRVVLVARHVEILGPSAIWYEPGDPLPGTDGRAIAVMHTTAPIVAHVDSRSTVVKVGRARSFRRCGRCGKK